MPFKLPQFTACCCGCSLRTGVYIIAVINIMLYILIECYVVSREITFMVAEDKSISQIEFLQNDMFDLSLFGQLVMSFCLLYGCYKNNPSYMLGFFMIEGVFVILYVITVLLYLLIYIMGVPYGVMFIYIIASVIQGYSALIVYSHYRNLKEGRSISI